MKITEWVEKNAVLKEGASIDDLAGLESDLNPLKNLETVDQTLSWMENNDLFNRAVTKAKTQAIEKHDEKFMSTKFPDLIKDEREKLIKELNPEETPEQKEIRELREKDRARDLRDAERELKKALRGKASELGYDPIKAERFHVYGENALEVMEKELKETKEYIASEIEKGLKEKFSNNPAPKGGDAPLPKDIDEQIREARKNGNFDHALRLQMQKKLKAQQ